MEVRRPGEVAGEQGPDKHVEVEEWLNEFRQRLREAVGSEKEREISVEIYYAPHGSAEHTRGLKDRIEKADIYFPEVFAWDLGVLHALRLISKGTLTPEQSLTQYPGQKLSEGEKYQRAKREALYGEKKAVALLDVPEGHPLVKELSEIETDFQHILAMWYPAPNKKGLMDFDLEQILRKYKENKKRQADFETKRENFMVSSLPSVLRRTMSDYPDLAKKPKLNLLLTLGSAHTRVSHLVGEIGLPVSRQFYFNPTLFSPDLQIMRRYMFGKEVSDELILQSLLYEDIALIDRGLAKQIGKTSVFTSKEEQVWGFIGAIAARFDENEIRRIFETRKELTPDEYVQSLANTLADKLGWDK